MKKWLDATGNMQNGMLWNMVWESISNSIANKSIWDIPTTRIFSPVIIEVEVDLQNQIKEVLGIRRNDFQ